MKVGSLVKSVREEEHEVLGVGLVIKLTPLHEKNMKQYITTYGSDPLRKLTWAKCFFVKKNVYINFKIDQLKTIGE